MPGPAPPSAGDLLQLRDLVQAFTGLRLEVRKMEHLSDQFAKLAQELGYGSIPALCRQLLQEAAMGTRKVWNAVLPLVTVNETYFFREFEQLKLFRDEVVPSVLSRKKNRQLRILSAPSSTGEEPYSLAMLLSEIAGALASWKVDIVGIDIDPRAIAKAQQGLFSRSAFRSTDERYVSRHFQAEGEQHRISDRIRQKVTFKQISILDLAGEPGMQDFDIAFCRNLLIYFDQATQLKVVNVLHSVLAPNGFLFLGHSESLLNLKVDFVPRMTKTTIYYEKASAMDHNLGRPSHV